MRTIARAGNGRRRGWLDDDFDQLFGGFFSPMQLIDESARRDLVPAVEVSETDDEYIVRAEMPGVNKDDVNVTLENGVLTISAETKSETEEKKGERIIRQERRYGKFLRSLHLGTDIKDSKVKATYRDGVLSLTLPKAEEVKPKRINVDIH